MPARRARPNDAPAPCSAGNLTGLDVSGRVAWYPTGTGLTGVVRDEWRPASPTSAVRSDPEVPKRMHG